MFLSIFSSKQLHTTLNQAPRKSHYDDHSWITDDQRKAMMTSPPPSSSQLPSYNNGRNSNDHRSASLTPHQHDLQIHRQAPNTLSMFHYGDPTDESHHYQQQQQQQYSRSTQQQRDFEPAMNRQQQSKQRTYEDQKNIRNFHSFLLHRKSPIRTTISSNNNRVLSVSGKLRCSRCHDELGS